LRTKPWQPWSWAHSRVRLVPAVTTMMGGGLNP
jgi:hypothetical protein